MRILMLKNPKHSRHPPREDVSWNIKCNRKRKGAIVILLVRMWVEMAWWRNRKQWTVVILLVRMWVEILQIFKEEIMVKSSSSWGCELKYEDYFIMQDWDRSSSSWGCELKWHKASKTRHGIRHPPREDVSWNTKGGTGGYTARVSSSSWGCELKWWKTAKLQDKRQSSSSWGCELKYYREKTRTESNASSSSWGCELKCSRYSAIASLVESSSSWGCELKCARDCNTSPNRSHPPREDVSWNTTWWIW